MNPVKVDNLTITGIQKLITGDPVRPDSSLAPYRSGPALVEFFNQFGLNETYGNSFPSRWEYAENKLKELNGKQIFKEVIETAVDPRHFLGTGFNIEDAVNFLNEHLCLDGYKLKKINHEYELLQLCEEGLPLPKEPLSPSLSKNKDYSEINNQGRAHSRNVAKIEYEGLLFRSEPEILLYKALKKTGIPFAPLPVFIIGGENFSRVEPDFVLLKDGVVLFVEVDGKAFHKESPADAHYRIKPFQDEGVLVERVKAKDCNTQESAEKYAKELIVLIEKKVKQK
ncbi:MAG: hypothetical protein AB7D06_14935 [Pedobacter sp.]